MKYLALGYSVAHIMERVGEPFNFGGWAIYNYVPLCRTWAENLVAIPEDKLEEFGMAMCKNCLKVDSHQNHMIERAT
jgi:hypothetical protein